MKQKTTFFNNNITYSMNRKTTLGVIISVILLIATITTVIPTILLQSAQAALDRFGGDVKARTGGGTLSSLAELEPEEKTPKHVPIATSGDNVYLVWPDNKTGNWEIFFKASSDGGKTFGSKINLSNDTTRSADGSIAAEGNNVYVTWWNTNNQTGMREPVFRASEDNGKTFGERLMLSSNVTSSGG
jgi:hypothetical protein